MVGPSGLEPPTSCLSGTRSNLLSYEPMWLVWILFTLRFFPFRKFLCLPFFSKKVSGGDDGIRLSRELRAQSFAALTVINCHSLPLLLRIPLQFQRHSKPLTFPWWRWWDSNPWPPACRAGALPAELHPHMRLLLHRFIFNHRSGFLHSVIVSALSYLPVQSPVKYFHHCRA